MSKGWCMTHWREHKRTGLDPVRVLPPYAGTRALCSFEGCGLWVKASGLCNGHYLQRSKGNDLTPLTTRHARSARDEHGRKRCRRCGTWKSEAEFYNDAGSSDGLNGYCMPCTRDAALESKYGVTPERYAQLLAAQNGRCAVCHTKPQQDANLHVDHDHSCCATESKSCGRCVRGLLCGDCNTALGLLRDDPQRLVSALQYLKRNT